MEAIRDFIQRRAAFQGNDLIKDKQFDEVPGVIPVNLLLPHFHY